MFEKTQRFLDDNVHGMLFGLIAAVIVMVFRNIEDKEIIFWVTLIAMIAGAVITHLFKIEKGFFNKKTVLIIAGLIVLISYFGIQTEMFAAYKKSSLWGWMSNKIFGKVLAITTIGGFLGTFNIFIGIIALILGLLMIGAPVGNLINVISDNFVLVLIVIGLALLLSLVMRKK